MTIFKTTPDEKLRVYELALKMRKDSTLSDSFVSSVIDLAVMDQGVFDLLQLWDEATETEDKEAVIADLQDAVDDDKSAVAGPIVKPKINFSNLDEVIKDVAAFKARLRIIVDQRGGITVLARNTGIPQPSLSRFFSSASMPRRTTLYKIAIALDLEERDIVSDWAQ